MYPEKTVWYRDPLHDDFAATKDKIRRRQVDGSYRYRRRGMLYRLFAFLLFHGFVRPVTVIWLLAVHGVRVRGRKALRGLKGRYFLYGNHTQNVADAFLPSLISFPRKCQIITGPETVSIPFVRFLTPLLGAIPLPDTLKGAEHFSRAIGETVTAGRPVAVYPEAHIWPYCTFIRPFPDDSFSYPVKHRCPAVPFTVTYRRRKLFRNAPPCLTVTVGKPEYPDPSLPPRAARRDLRDRVYGQMTEAAAGENAAYIVYRRLPESDPDEAEELLLTGRAP